MDNRMKCLLSQAQQAYADDEKMLGCLVLTETMFQLFRDDHGSLTWYGLYAELGNRLSDCGDDELLRRALASALDAMKEHRPG
ncbi:hypothetical protein [Amorphus sp. MBR-141]